MVLILFWMQSLPMALMAFTDSLYNFVLNGCMYCKQTNAPTVKFYDSLFPRLYKLLIIIITEFECSKCQVGRKL